MPLTTFIGPNESIQVQFRISTRFFIFQILLVVLAFGGLAIFYAGNIFIAGIIVIIALLLLLYITVIYLTTRYFATERRIYKRVGFIFRKVVSSPKEQVASVFIDQDFFARIFFSMGTMLFDTEGSQIDIEMEKVGRPFNKRKQIYGAWGI